ncbi:PilN domain-containing protein [Shewanella avicenniae]|uniref:PilN domain-containing protein n=1 Tax=Shewanella avicenniae TaxID=2814294 RepID=A0ABX7QT46_9GAMM|nr:PilN domain-containing protein [Shewanella avicenniae]QSX34033.1 PilN domain-containing protein [Shewanella avicenniae]
MANINLLPWREEAREKKKRDYLGILGLVFVGAALLVYLAISFIGLMTEDQRERNAYLQNEIQQLDKQIAEITKIKQRKADIEKRTEIILNLQQSRNLPTHILDELVKIIPPGVYLSSVEKKGSIIWIEGRSESNNNVANMMRKIKASEWLQDPSMQSIVSQQEDIRELQRFKLKVTVKGGMEELPAATTKGAGK